MNVINVSVGISVLFTSLFLRLKEVLFNNLYVSIITFLITFCTPLLVDDLIIVLFIYFSWLIILCCIEKVKSH